MPTYDERFARQYRYEPPSEFPLTLPFAGIIHHLSGLNTHALTQTFPIDWSVAGAKIPAITFIAHRGLTPEDLHRCWTPWSVFQNGSNGIN